MSYKGSMTYVKSKCVLPWILLTVMFWSGIFNIKIVVVSITRTKLTIILALNFK